MALQFEWDPRKAKSKPEKEMRKQYDFSGGVRAKYARRYVQGSNVVVLDPDVARVYPNAKAVNRALRALVVKSARRVSGKNRPG